MASSCKSIAPFSLLALSLLFSGHLFSAGMTPASSVVLVSADQGESIMNVRNTDEHAALLYTSLETIAEDPEMLLVVSPPVTRVEGGDSQAVRFILQTKEPIKTQRLMRVTFEGIPPVQSKVANSVGVTFRQNLPVIISPKGLKPEPAPWRFLKWSVCGDRLKVTNDSLYVVRLALSGLLLPGNEKVNFRKAYVLPHAREEFKLNNIKLNTAAIRIYPASVYGYAVAEYDAPLIACTSK